jgi:hypothetical protein
MSDNKRCYFGLHHYEVYKEVEVKELTGENKGSTCGINIVSRCSNCGKIKVTFVATDANYLNDGRGVRA